MFIYPQFDPIALQIGPLAIRWYGLMYVIGFLVAWGLGNYRAKHSDNQWTAENVSDLIFNCVLGLVLGARIGYILFYNFPLFLANPLVLFKVWQGGMSFHGGLIGVVFAAWYFAYRNNKTFGEVADFVAPLVPLGLAAGRLGNFINGELWGRVTNVPWAMVFPHVDNYPRHPSQVYEMLLEGIALFAIVWLYSAKPRPRLAVSGLFLLCYGLFRFMLEFFRVPDPQLGFLAWEWLSMGQLLSIPMVLFGGTMLYYAYFREPLQLKQQP